MPTPLHDELNCVNSKPCFDCNNPLDEKRQALLQHLHEEEDQQKQLTYNDIEEGGGYDYAVNLPDGDTAEYVVYTDEEADEIWDENLENYVDECILPEIPEPYRLYFDFKSWKDDARLDGRGHSISLYDGNEYEQTVNGTTYYIYRMN